jgi:hypothetical protein
MINPALYLAFEDFVMYQHPLIGVLAPTESKMLELMSGLRNDRQRASLFVPGTGIFITYTVK